MPLIGAVPGVVRLGDSCAGGRPAPEDATERRARVRGSGVQRDAAARQAKGRWRCSQGHPQPRSAIAGAAPGGAGQRFRG